jgi:hypothetical protein
MDGWLAIETETAQQPRVIRRLRPAWNSVRDDGPPHTLLSSAVSSMQLELSIDSLEELKVSCALRALVFCPLRLADVICIRSININPGTCAEEDAVV